MMGWFARRWGWWVAHCAREEDLRPLALVRILVPLCVLGDLLRTAQLGLVPMLFKPYELGGFGAHQDGAWRLDDLLGGEVAGPVSWWVTVLCMPLISAGVAVRPAIILGCLAYAQLGHSFPPGDRGVDRIMRIALLIVLFSAAHRCWALGPRLRKMAEQRVGPAWPSDLLKWQLVLIYLGAGVAKLMRDPTWLDFGKRSSLYRIFTDPLVGRLDASFWADWQPIFQVGAVFTIVLELSPLLILTRWCRWWALGGVFLHLGIFAVMDLGMFPWGMLALYPVLLAGWFRLRHDAGQMEGVT